MKTGFSRICITPPLGVPILGYYEKRVTKGVLDDLYVSAVSFDDGESRAVILAVDVCLLSTAQSNKAKALITERTGLDASAIFINCSHTHTGPVIEKDFDDTPGDSEYDDFFYNALAEATALAFEDMRESVFSVGKGTADRISFVRRFRMKNGGVQTNPGVDNPDILHSLGTPNDTVKFFKIDREGGETLVVVNFGTHADTVGGEFISGDWPSFVCKTVETVFENTKCVFLTGSQGDVNHINPKPTAGDRKGLEYDSFDNVPRGYEHAKHMGRKVAAAVIAMLDKTEPVAADRISFGTKEISIPANRENHRLAEAEKICELHNAGRDSELPYEKMELTTAVAEANRIVKLKDGPDAFNYVLSALRLGDVVLAGLPGECFVDIGRTIEREYGTDSIFVCCLTNGGDTYFPTSSAYDEGGYEARSSSLRKGGDKILTDGMAELLNTIK